MPISINHVAIFVSDLEGARAFYETYFDAVANELYHNPRTGLRTYFLTFDGMCRLEIMERPDVQEPAVAGETGWNHVAFSLGSAEAVDRLVERLRGDGFTATDPRTTGDGYYESVVRDREGNNIEITI